MYAVPDTGKLTRKLKSSDLSEFGTILCSDYEIVSQVKKLQEDGSLCNVLMLGDFHKRGSVEIKVGMFGSSSETNKKKTFLTGP